MGLRTHMLPTHAHTSRLEKPVPTLPISSSPDLERECSPATNPPGEDTFLTRTRMSSNNTCPNPPTLERVRASSAEPKVKKVVALVPLSPEVLSLSALSLPSAISSTPRRPASQLN